MSRAVLVWLTFACAPAVGHAHGFVVEASAAGGELRVSARYDTGEPAPGATVTVTAAGGEVVASGFTNSEGVWVGDLPRPGDYRVRADDGRGHGSRIKFTVTASGVAPAAGTPWPRGAKVALGLAVIAALTLGWKFARGRGPTRGAPPPTGPPAVDGGPAQPRRGL